MVMVKNKPCTTVITTVQVQPYLIR